MDDSIDELIKEWMKRKLVLLLDGYDEIKSYDLDVYIKNNFHEFEELKIIITSRISHELKTEDIICDKEKRKNLIEKLYL